jgi:hypothetical protein
MLFPWDSFSDLFHRRAKSFQFLNQVKAQFRSIKFLRTPPTSPGAKEPSNVTEGFAHSTRLGRTGISRFPNVRIFSPCNHIGARVLLAVRTPDCHSGINLNLFRLPIFHALQKLRRASPAIRNVYRFGSRKRCRRRNSSVIALSSFAHVDIQLLRKARSYIYGS